MSATKPRAELRVPGDRLGAQQGLRLPDQRPALVVGRVRRQRADQRPVPALGSQVGVDDERRVRRRAAPAAAGAPPATAWRRLGASRSTAPGQRVVDEQHVGVAAVAELVAAEPPHRHDAQPGRQRLARAPPRRPRTAAASPASIVAAVTSVRASPTSRTSSRPSRSATAIRNSSRRRTARTAAIASAWSSWRPAAASISVASASRRRGTQLVVVAEQPHRLGRAQQQVGGVAAGGEHPRHPLGGRRSRRGAAGGTTGVARGRR